MQGRTVEESATSVEDSVRPSSKQQSRRTGGVRWRTAGRRGQEHMSGQWTLSLDSGEKASD